MNWIKDIIPNIKRNLSQTFGEGRQSKVPEGLWRSCENCGAILYIPELKKSSYVCSKCGHHFKIDVSDRIEVTFDEGSYKSLNLKEVEKKHGIIDIFINNAGIAGMNTTVAEYPLDEWKKVMNLNLNSVFYCCKAVVPFMLKNDYGRIVNIASIAGKEGNPNASAYSTSKAGVIGLTKSLGKELAQKNIAVNCVTPAAAKTRIFDQMTEEHINYMLSKIPRNKFAKVEELASLVAWLSSEENSFSTAAVFDLSGGRATY